MQTYVGHKPIYFKLSGLISTDLQLREIKRKGYTLLHWYDHTKSSDLII